LHFLVVEVRVK